MLLLASIFFFFVSLSTFHWISYSSQYLELSSVCCYLPPQSPGWIITLYRHAGSLVSVAAVSPHIVTWGTGPGELPPPPPLCTLELALLHRNPSHRWQIWQYDSKGPCCWLKSKSAAPTTAPWPTLALVWWRSRSRESLLPSSAPAPVQRWTVWSQYYLTHGDQPQLWSVQVIGDTLGHVECR